MGVVAAFPGALMGALLGPWIFGPTTAVLGFFAGDFLIRLAGSIVLGVVGALAGGAGGSVFGALLALGILPIVFVFFFLMIAVNTLNPSPRFR